jgi:hypothetical protein
VIPILAGLWALVGTLGLVWLVARGRLRRTGQRADSGLSAQAKRDFDADWIYGDRPERKREARPQQRKKEAELEAEAIVKEAKRRAGEILAGAELARTHVEAELAREQAHMAEKSKKLSEFLESALEEVERAAANGRAGAHDVDELEALRDELRNTE